MNHHKHHVRLRRAIVCCGLLVVLSSVTTIALASRRIVAEESAYRAPTNPQCVASDLNRSDVLPGTKLAVSPVPDARDASPNTQISLLGVPISSLHDISVTGSDSGVHKGHLRAYSQGDGASFVPSNPFRAGETVTVHGHVNAGHGTEPFAFHFIVAKEDDGLFKSAAASTGAKPAALDPGEEDHFHSAPKLEAPLADVTANAAPGAGDIFAAPYSGPGPSGPTIFNEAGELVWFDPLPGGIESTNLQVQQFDGAPALTWWQGEITPQGFGRGEEVIDNSDYHTVARIHAGNGFKADLHEFRLTPQGTALLTVFNPVDCNLSSVGGPAGGAATDSLYQEIDVKTGLVRREWTSLDHVGLGDSYSSATSSSTLWPFDYFHLNSIDPLASGNTLISSRNTSALYELNTTTGQILTRVGGKSSSVKIVAGASTAYQHDATMLPNGTISVFDNGAVPKVHAQSRGLILSVNPQSKTDTVLAEYKHTSPPLSSGSQGNVQVLEDGNVFVGWGAEPYFSEYSSSGQLLYDAHLHGSYESYRTYRFPWTGTPSEPPAIADSAPSASAPVTVYASWNGSTQTASWRVLAGPSPQQLTAVASAPSSGIATAIATPGPEPYVAVQALNSAGAVIGTSHTIAR